MSWLRHVQFQDRSDERRAGSGRETSDLFRTGVLNDYRQMIASAELLKDTIPGNPRMVISPGGAVAANVFSARLKRPSRDDIARYIFPRLPKARRSR